MPTNMNKYPPDWKEKRERILKRAKNCCENCGLKNKANVWSIKLYNEGCRVWVEKWDEAMIKAMSSGWGSIIGVKPYPIIKPVKVVLTIAHLDHDEENWDVSDDRLMAMCQACHLKYDAKEKYRRVMEKNKSQ